MQVKICGITEPESVRSAIDAGASALGFVFADSPRRVAPEHAAALAADLPASVATVAVFRHPTERELRDTLRVFDADLVQAEPGPAISSGLAGSGARLLPVLHDGPDLFERLEEWPLPGVLDGAPVLLEGPGRGGRGVRPDWARAARLAARSRLVLAGGLTPENVARAIRAVRPAAVDVSSGVETRPGRKDPELIRRFVAAALAADARGGPVPVLFQTEDCE